MVHRRERYIVGWTPRVYGYSPGKPSLSGYCWSSSPACSSRGVSRLSSLPGSATRGTSMPDEVSKRVFRSENLSSDFLSVVSFHLLYCSLRVIVVALCEKILDADERRKRRFVLFDQRNQY